MTSSAPRPQPRGGVAADLLAAGVALAREAGPEAVVLREATRRVGVSPAAAYRHYADHHALLRAVGAVAMAGLAEAMELELERLSTPGAGTEVRARLRLRAAGAGYLRFAREQPGLFRTAFATVDDTEGDPGARGRSGLTPLQLLTAALDGLVEAGSLSARRRPGAEHVAWSAVHGLATLLHGPLRTLDEDAVQRAHDQVLDSVERGLLEHPPPARPRRARTS